MQVATKMGVGEAVPPTSLVYLETSEPIRPTGIFHPRYGSSEHDPSPSASLQEQSFRHSGWQHNRERVYAALMSTGQPNRRLDAFANCGNALWLAQDGDELVLQSNCCRDRLCVPCQVSRQQNLVAAICAQIADTKYPVRFLTLTLRARKCTLRDQLDRLSSCFKTMRRRRTWKANVLGGAIFIETKLGKNSHEWHVHAHCLIEGDYTDQRHLSQEWHAVTGDSYIVDIREITNPVQRAWYVTKYATKPADASVYADASRLQEFVVGIKGRRLYQTFGSWRALDLDADPPPSRTLKYVGNVGRIFADAAAGDATARRYVEAALRKWPQLSVFVVHPTNSNEEFIP